MDAMQFTAATAALIGLITATIMPYWRKRPLAGEWDHKYTLGAIVAILMAAATMETTIMAYAETVSTTGGVLLALIGAFMYGFGLARGTVEIGKLIAWARRP